MLTLAQTQTQTQMTKKTSTEDPICPNLVWVCDFSAPDTERPSVQNVLPGPTFEKGHCRDASSIKRRARGL